MANPLAVTLHASGAETAAGSGTSVDIGALRSVLKLTLDVTELSGTSPSVTVTVETSPTGTGWKAARTLTAVTAVGALKVIAAGLERYVRASWTIGGSGGPSVTFAVTAVAHAIYAEPGDLDRYGAPEDSYAGLTLEQKADKLLAATSEAESHLAAAYTLPLTAWGDSLRYHVARMATAAIMDRRGIDPEGADNYFGLMRKQAIDWLKMVATGKTRPPEIVDSATAELEIGGYIAQAETKRGW